jgi:hypothetical protein
VTESENPVATVEIVTPALAAEWLVGNTHNRSMKNAAIERFAKDIRAGLWDLNGESIKFNGDGRLLDGQNRLQAVVLADAPIATVVVRGIAPETQETIDMGVPRSLADVLKLRGEVSCIDLAAGVTRLWNYERDPLDSSFATAPTIHQALGFLEVHPALRESIHTATSVRKATGLRGSVGVALHYITTSLDAEDAEVFWLRLTTGANLETGDAVYHLRNALLADRAGSQRTQKMTAPREWALAVKAWNAYREGREIKLLVWRPGGAHPESFPVPA